MESDSDLDLADLGNDTESVNTDDNDSSEYDELPDLYDVVLNTTAPTMLSNSNDGGSDAESSDNDLPDLDGVVPIVLSSSNDDRSDAESSDDELPDLEGVVVSNSNDDLVDLGESDARSSPLDIFMDDYAPSSTNTVPLMVNSDPRPPYSAYEQVTAANEVDFARQVMRILPPDYFDTVDNPRYPLDDIKQEDVPRKTTIVFTDPTIVPLATVSRTKTGMRFWDER
jgi:hypothetical protein